jgi:hypothetical protein
MSHLCDEGEWSVVKGFLPADLEEMARRTGALQRARGIKDAETLLRVLMMHVAGGLSLAQTAVRAAELGFADVSAVALFKRLRAARQWLESLCQQLIGQTSEDCAASWPLPGRIFRALDGSDIREPGATGSSWKLHYSVTLPELRCDYAEFTSCHHGERLQNFPLQPRDVVLADRAYDKRAQIAWLQEIGADAIIRLHPPAFPSCEPADEQLTEGQTDLPVDWLAKLRCLPEAVPGEWQVRFHHQCRSYTVRICALRKSNAAAASARHKIEREAYKKRRVLREETLALADFVVILTTLPTTLLSASQILEIYRCRWQVELAFKRLKSLLDFGAVPKEIEPCARAWMQGKLLQALLIEKLLAKASALSPSGEGVGRMPLATFH